MLPRTRIRLYIYKNLYFTRMSGWSVDVDVTVLDEDEKHQRKYIIKHACPDSFGHPRDDELLDIKLKEIVPFKYWMRLTGRVDNKWWRGTEDILYNKFHEEKTEQWVTNRMRLLQKDIIWRGEPRVTMVLKICGHMPRMINNFLDGVVMPSGYRGYHVGDSTKIAGGDAILARLQNI